MNERYTSYGSGDSGSNNNLENNRSPRLLSVVIPGFNGSGKSLKNTVSINRNFTSEDRMNRFDSEFSSQTRSVGRWLHTLVLTALVAVGLLGSSIAVEAQYSVTMGATVNPMCAGSPTTLSATLAGGPIEGSYADAGLAYAAPYAAGGNEVILNLDDDEVSAQQFVGNVFRFYGSDIDLNDNGFWIGSNGFITFRDDVFATQIVPRNLAVPGAGQTYHTIYIANADMSPQLGGDVWYEVQNQGGGDVLLVTYDGVPLYNSANPLVNSGLLVTVQAVLYLNGHPNAGRIEIRVDLFPDNNIVAAPANKQTVSIGALNNCQNPAPAANGAIGEDQFNPAADIDDVTYSYDPDGPAITATSTQFFYCGTTACTAGGTLLGTDAAAPFTQNWLAPASTTDATHYFRSEMTLSNCNVVESASFAVTVNAQPTSQSLNPSALSVCEGGSLTYSVTQTIANSTFNWSSTAPFAGIVTAGANNENATITFPAGGSNGGTAYVVSVDEVGPAPTNCTVTSTVGVTIYTNPVGPLTSGFSSMCSGSGLNTGLFANPGYGSYVWSLTAGGIYGTLTTVGAGTNTNTFAVNGVLEEPTGPQTVTVQVVMTNGGICQTTETVDITINPRPNEKVINQAPVGNPCQFDIVTYSVVAPTPGNTYAWTASGGGFNFLVPVAYVNGTPIVNQTSVSLQWTTSGAGRNISVTETTPNGCTRTYAIASLITVEPIPTPVVVGANNPCQYQAPTVGNPSYETTPNPIEYTYFVNAANPAHGYRWTVSGGNIVAVNGVPGANPNPFPTVGTFSVGSSNITVRWISTGPQTVTVRERSAAGCEGESVFNVNVTATPIAADFNMTGPGIGAANPCAGSPGHIYPFTGTNLGGAHTITVVGGTITGTTGAGYVINGGGTQVTGGTGNGDITVTWGLSPSGEISHEYNSGGCSAVETYTITINPLPSGVITGSANLCGAGSVSSSSTGNYTVTGVTNGPIVTYAWSITGGAGLVASTAGAGTGTFTVNANNTGSGSVEISVDITNLNGCTETLTRTIQVWQTPPAAVVGGGAGPHCAGGTTTWTFTGVAYGTTTIYNISGGTPTTATTFAGVGPHNFTIQWDNQVTPPGAPTFNGSFNHFQRNTLAPITCYSAFPAINVVVNATPAVPILAAIPPLCINTPLAIPLSVTNVNPGVVYTWAQTGGLTLFLGGIGPQGQLNFILGYGGVGAKSITVTATLAGCTSETTENFNVDPVPNPVISGDLSACQDTTNPLGKPHGGTFGFTYEYTTAQVVGNTYAWTVSNGFIDAYSTDGGTTWTNLPGNVVPADVSTSAILDANTIRVVFWGSNPGKVKVTEAHPGGCSFTTLDYNVNLNTRPDIQVLTVSTNICSLDPGTASIAASQVGYNYRVEKSTDGGTSWVPVTVATPTAVQAGTGAAINWTINPSELTYTATPPNVTPYEIRVTALQDAPWVTCGWYIASNLETINVNPKPANNIPISIVANEVCEGADVEFNVGDNVTPSEAWVSYRLMRRQIRDLNDVLLGLPTPWIYVSANVEGNGVGSILLQDQTDPAGGVPLIANDNYEYRVEATSYMAFVPPPNIQCTTLLVDEDHARIFALPTDPTVTFTPNPVCWEEDVVVNMTNTQNGVQYEVNIAGVSLAPPVIIDGNGGAVSVNVNSVYFQPTNPIGLGSVTVADVQARAYLSEYGAFIRPIPTDGCPVQYGTVDLDVLEKPVAEITGPDTVCGPSTVDYVATLVTPAPGTYDWMFINNPDAPPAGTLPLVANNTGPNTVNPLTVDFGINLLSCDGSYNPLNTQLQLIATNANGCTDTALIDITVNPTVNDAEVVGDTTACIYGGFEDHLKTYSVERPGLCVFPDGTEYLWTMPSGTVSGAIRSGQFTPTIVAEWHTTGGTNIGTVTCQVTLPDSVGGCITTRTLDVVVYPLPQPVITGPVNVCQNQQGVVYTADNYPSDTYTWEVLGGTVVGGSGTGVAGDLGTITGVGINVITVNWLDEANPNAYVKLTQISIADCMNETIYDVTVHPTPVPAIDGPAIVCDNAVSSYSTANNAPNNVYNWSISGNATIQSGSNQASVSVLTGAFLTGSSFTLTLTETVQATTCETTVQRTINIVETPNPTITRISPVGGFVGGACLGQVVEYGDTDPVAANLAYSYMWTVANGAIDPGTPANGSTIKVEWNTVGTGTVTLAKWHAGTQCTTTVSQDVNITEIPEPAIAGPIVVCGDDVANYSTPAVVGNNYMWTVVGDAAVIGGANANQAIVEFSNAATAAGGAATLTVVETNTLSGCSGTATVNITVGYMPQATVIAGNETVCNASTETYSIVSEPVGLDYLWTVTGGTIVTNNGSSIDVMWTAEGNQTVGVTISTPGTNCETTITKNVTVEYQPAPAITGDAIVCTDDVEVYSTPANAGSTYAWNVTGGTITSGATSNAITVEWTNAGAQTVSVTESNASGNCFASTTLNVLVAETPGTTEITLNGPGNIGQACEGSTETYGTDTPNPGTYEYMWTVTGGEFTAGDNTPTVDVHWVLVGTQTLTVTVTTPGTDCEVTIVQNIAITPQPQPNIDGATVACINKDHVYQTPYVPGNTYEWTITPANVFAPITGYPASNVIEVKWIQPGLHLVELTEENVAGGCATTVSINVQVNLIPTPFITSVTGYGNPAGRRPGIVCNFSAHTYTTFATPANTWIWTVEGGTIVTGQYTNTIDVLWGPSGIGTIAVEETIPGSDCITTILDSIDIRPTPTPVITGEFDPCGNSVEQYATPFVSGNSWAWTVIGGTILNGQGTSNITVRWNQDVWPNTIAGNVKVVEWVTDVLPSMTCIDSTNVNITVRPNPPVPTITGPAVVCATDLNTTPATDNMVTYVTSVPAQGGAQGFISYAWSTSANGQIIGSSTSTSLNVRWTNAGTSPVNGVVTVVHTSTFGCTSQTSYNVTINPIPTPDISGPTSVCQNAIHTYSTPGLPGHVYNWTVVGGNIIRSGQGTPNVTVEWSLPGSYDLSVNETNTYGCDVTNTITVTVNELPNATIMASGPTTFCQGGDVTLTAPIGFASYVWSTGETARSIVVRTTGTYWVKVTDDNGCSNNSDTITVSVFPNSLPIISVSGPTTFCEGGEVTLTAPAGFDAYLWSTGESTQSITVSETGSYTVIVADNNGCTGTSTEVDVFVNAKPTPILTVVGSTTVCSGDSVEVRAPAGFVSYMWESTSGTDYGTERSAWVLATDTLYCTVVDANGCVGESDTVAITVAPVIAPVIAPNGPTTFCEGGSVKLTAPEGFATYYWSNGATSREINVSDAGSYFVTVTNVASCESISDPTDIAVNPLPSRPDITRTGDTLKAVTVVAETYQWFRNGVMVPGAIERNLVVTKPGTYRVEIADNNTCSSISDGFDVILTSVDEDVVAGHAPEMAIFPNPTNGQFTIETEIHEAGTVRIELVNTVGEVVLSLNEVTNGGLFTQSVDMGTLASGVYHVVVSTSNQRWNVQVVRQ